MTKAPRLLFALSAALLACGAAPTAAQPYGPDLYITVEPTEDDRLLPLPVALDRLLRLELDNLGAHRTLWRASESGDPSLVPVLRQIADAFAATAYVGYGQLAFYAMSRLGEPPETFIEIAEANAATYSSLTYYALRTAAPYADSALYLRVLPLKQYGDFVESGAGALGTTLQLEVSFDAVSQRQQSRGLLNQLQNNFVLPHPEEDFHTRYGPTHGTYDIWPESVWARNRLARTARERPTIVREAIAEHVQRRAGPHGAELSAAYEAHLLGLAFPPGTVQPPANATANVRPILECVAPDATGALVAHFGYENLTGAAVTIPLGPTSSQIAPAASDGEQPEVFVLPGVIAGRPGRTPYYPAAAFHVSFQPGGTVAWTLAGRTVTASAASLRCDRYLPDAQAIASLPAAVVVPARMFASFSGASFLVSGRAHTATGVAVAGTPAVRAVLASSPEGAAVVVAAVAQNQRGLLPGQAASPDVTSGALGFDPAAWADRLAARASVQLPASPAGPVGSAAAPVVAYAPAGARLAGTFRGHGVLVVDGTFAMVGAAQWTGLVVVRGASSQQAEPDLRGSARIVGGLVLVEGAGGQPARLDLAGASAVLYSPDALALALRAAAAP